MLKVSPLLPFSSLFLLSTKVLVCEGFSDNHQHQPHRQPHWQQQSFFNGLSDITSIYPPARENTFSSIRRVLIWSSVIAPVTWSSPVNAAAENAQPLDAGEAIRRSAANIPGYGQTDVFFPDSFAGPWKVTRDVEFVGKSTKLRLQYPIRFIRSIEDGAVVADRGYNQAGLEQSIAETLRGGKEKDENSAAAVRSYEWTPSNPNDLRIVLSDGTRKEIKVTKRATERTDDYVSFSEFQRLTQEGQGGVPAISARRVVSKWRKVDPSTLEAMEIMYDMGGGDPLAGASTKAGTMLSKSKLLLVR